METGFQRVGGRVLWAEYSDESEEYAVFLIITRTLPMPRSKLRAWKKIAMNFFVRDGFLFWKMSRNVAIRRVVDDPDLCTAAIWEIYCELGY
jgi:hypothetical protein